ncbi:MAG: RcpC/CpaB family pilus assembly protein [Sporichthyaceae bacterium]|nr:RcpC/CpaB family pilus assembly protein [Sporichthyaceae bacterium]
MGRRLALMFTAVVIAAAGTLMVFLYVQRADARALADQDPIRVLTATSVIPAGTSMRQAQTNGHLEERVVARSSAVDQPVASIVGFQELVTLTTIVPNQQISRSMLGERPLTTAALPLNEGDIAVSFQFTDPGRVAGFVQPGSQVAVFATVSSTEGETTRVLLEEALVLAVGPSTTTTGLRGSGPTNSEELPRALLTLSLSDEDAAKLVYASGHGTLYLGLRGENSRVSTGTVISQQNLFR